jgi:formylglycine-generating enzyme required for sulfatase activity
MLEALHLRTGLVFVLIPGGEFRMGSLESEEGHCKDESPVHTVRVPAFLLCRTECTQRAWDGLGGEDERHFRGPGLPIEMVRWSSVKAWCGRTGLRLPTEAEWEYACRAGTTTPFSFGPAIAPPQVNYDGDYPYAGAPQGQDRQRTVPCGSLPANPWGLHEVHGNVYEWCEDHLHGSYDGAPSDGSAWETGDSPVRVFRGGGWLSYARSCRSAYRDGDGPDFRWRNLGFRPAGSLP